MARVETDFLVVGSGIAGLTTALSLAEYCSVIVLTKAREEESNSFHAQGGIAAAIGEDDSPELHRQDTLRTGVNLCNPASVDVLVNMGPRAIQKLADWGTDFDLDGGQWALGKEGSHSVSRILHVDGDATGAGITSNLLRRAMLHSNIQLITHTMVTDLIMHQEVCRGAIAVDEQGETFRYFAKQAVILATGGCGQIYQYTTNDPVSTGDGVAMAYRAGAKLSDMEFVQFHPTALAVEQNPMFLISEAVRGEGAFLVNDCGEAFMERYHSWKDLAPRDVVSRAIFQEMEQGRKVYLNAIHLGKRFQNRFPKIYKALCKFGIDPCKDWIPVTPAAHFIMGGIYTDIYGQTTISRLFACGEVACTGVHGANRLASNSLLEGTVFAQRVAEKCIELVELETDFPELNRITLCKNKHKETQWKQTIRQVMWKYAGIVRTEEGLTKGISQLKQLETEIPQGYFECRNMLMIAQVVMESALSRRESRGSHYRSDYPKPQKSLENKHQII